MIVSCLIYSVSETKLFNSLLYPRQTISVMQREGKPSTSSLKRKSFAAFGDEYSRKRRYCPHCNANLSYSAYLAHKSRFYDHCREKWIQQHQDFTGYCQGINDESVQSCSESAICNNQLPSHKDDFCVSSGTSGSSWCADYTSECIPPSPCQLEDQMSDGQYSDEEQVHT